MNFLKELRERWNAKLPEFWVKVKSAAVFVTVGASSVWVANTAMNLQLSGFVLEFCRYAIVAGVFTGLSAQLTKTDSNENKS